MERRHQHQVSVLQIGVRLIELSVKRQLTVQYTFGSNYGAYVMERKPFHRKT